MPEKVNAWNKSNIYLNVRKSFLLFKHILFSNVKEATSVAVDDISYGILFCECHYLCDETGRKIKLISEILLKATNIMGN